jgi:hypothetical protein
VTAKNGSKQSNPKKDRRGRAQREEEDCDPFDTDWSESLEDIEYGIRTLDVNDKETDQPTEDAPTP